MKRFLSILAAFSLIGCAGPGTVPAPGHIYTDPISKSVGDAQARLGKASPQVDKAVTAGAKPGDLKGASTDIHAAQKTLDKVPVYVTAVNKVIDDAGKTITKQNVTLVKQHHRIMMDDAVIASISLCVLGWAFITFGLPLLKLLKFAV